MIVCPKCNKPMDDSARFCSSCGAPAPASPSSPSPVQASAPLPGSAPAQAPPAPDAASLAAAAPCPSPKRRIPRIALLLGGIGLAVLITAVIATAMLAGPQQAQTAPDCAVYIQDRELMLTDAAGKASRRITTRLADNPSIDNELLAMACFRLASDVTLSRDGQTIFFPDKMSDLDRSSISVYYRKMGAPDEDAVKIDSDILYYLVNEDATLVTYLKDPDYALYQYDLRRDEKTKIAESVERFACTDDHRRLGYIDGDQNLYVKDLGKAPEKLASGMSHDLVWNENLSAVTYIQDTVLYHQKVGGKKIKLDSDVSYILHAYDTGEMYYTTSRPTEASVAAFVENDLEGKPPLPAPDLQEPVAPHSWDFMTSEEYDAAYEHYVQEHNAYLEAVKQQGTAGSREKALESLYAETISIDSETLWYYNGSEKKRVLETYVFIHEHDPGYGDPYVARDTPAFVFQAYTGSPGGVLRLSEIENTDDIGAEIFSALYAKASWHVASKATLSELPGEASPMIYLQSDGKALFYMDKAPDEDEPEEEGWEGSSKRNLYRAGISGGKLQEPELYDTGIHTYGASLLESGNLVYYKNNWDLFIDKAPIDNDVLYFEPALYAEKGLLYYFTDWDNDRMRGTLKMYENGESRELADNVHSFSVFPDGGVLYLCDFSPHYYTGTLHLLRDEETVKLADEVAGILPSHDRAVIGGMSTYGW